MSMKPHAEKTDKTAIIKMPSEITHVRWTRTTAVAGGSVGLEILTSFVGNGSNLQIDLSDATGRKYGVFKEQIAGNRFWAEITIPGNAHKAFVATAKLPKHGLELTSPALFIVPPVKITNAKWDKGEARRGDVLTLSAEVKGALDGTEAQLSIWEHDEDGAHDLVTRLPALIEGERIATEWQFIYPGDLSGDLPALEECEGDYIPPTFFFRVEVNGVSAESDNLLFTGWIGLELADADGAPVPDEPYILELPDGTQRDGVLDENGQAVVLGVDAGTCRVTFPDAAETGATSQRTYENDLRDAERATAARHRFSLDGSLIIALDVMPEEVEESEEIFVLTSTGGQWTTDERRRVRDDAIAIDELICLQFDHLCPEAAYTLAVSAGGDREEKIFEDVPYRELSALSDEIDAEAVTPY